MHGWTRLPAYEKGQAAKKRNLAATITSAQLARVDLGAELSVVCVVRLWSSARLYPSWELLLPLTPSSPSTPVALYKAVKLFYIMSTPHNNHPPFYKPLLSL